uniref:Zinc finger protein 724-like isoform X3 n=1 Tax=Diabrotica virgifera virgifera TaxID=50390 RepID=A0A6P7GA55_DIAVI
MTSPVALYLCRLCLNKTPTRVNIFGGDFPRMLEILTSIKVDEEDGLPKYSCIKCAKEVQMCLMVKKRIIKAHQFLLEGLKKKKTTFESTVITRIVNKGESSVQNKTKTAKQKVVSKKSNPVITQNKTQCKSKLFDNSNEAATDEDAYDNSNEATTDEDANEGSVKHDVKTEGVETTNQPNAIKEEKESLDEEVHEILDEDQKCIESTGFTCETCNLTFSDKPTFNLHSLKHKKSKCHICGRFIRSDNIKKHIMLHTAGPSVCSICGATCKNIESLRGHIFYQHKSKAEQYICEECGKTFRVKYKFLLHKKKAHMGLRNFKCTTCGKAFFTNGNLLTHVRMTHEKLRPHVCEYCGTGFSSTYALKTHKRQHTNEKPFVCEHCLEGFRQRVSLRSHLKSKHGIEEVKEFFCKTCEKGFATNYALSIHERLHETMKCEICSENFAGGDYLTNHLREVHNMEVEMAQDT